MTGLKLVRANVVACGPNAVSDEYKLDIARAQQLSGIETLQASFDRMHKEVAKEKDKARLKAIESHNAKTGLINPNFSVGDFVLVRRGEKSGNKLTFRWRGPRRVVRAIHPVLYEVEDLVSGKAEQVHASRLLLYKESTRGKEASLKLRGYAEHTEANYETIEEFLELGEDPSGVYVRIRWAGLPDERDSTWQEVGELSEDVPEMLEVFLKSCKDKGLVSKACNIIKHHNSAN